MSEALHLVEWLPDLPTLSPKRQYLLFEPVTFLVTLQNNSINEMFCMCVGLHLAHICSFTLLSITVPPSCWFPFLPPHNNLPSIFFSVFACVTLDFTYERQHQQFSPLSRIIPACSSCLH